MIVSLYCSEMLKGGPEGLGLFQEKFERSERTGFLHISNKWFMNIKTLTVINGTKGPSSQIKSFTKNLCINYNSGGNLILQSSLFWRFGVQPQNMQE